MQKFIEFDMISTPFFLNVQKKSRYKNFCGAVLSIFAFIFTGSLFLILGKDMYTRSNPQVLEKTLYPDSNDVEYNLSRDNFFFAFKTENTAGLYDRPDLFYLQLTFEEVRIDPETGIGAFTQQKIVPYSKCTFDHVKHDYIWNAATFEGSYCADIDDLKIGGNWDSEWTRVFKVKLFHCSQNPNPSVPCSSDEEAIKQVFKDSFFISTIHQDFYLNAEDVEAPFKITPVYSYYLMDYTIFKKRYLYFLEGIFRDDLGWIGNTFSYDYKLGLSREFQTSSSIEPSLPLIDRQFYEIMLVHIKEKKQFNRSFMKIPQLLAVVGGFNRLIMICLKFVNTKYASYYYPLKLVKEMFDLSYTEGYDVEETVDKKKHVSILDTPSSSAESTRSIRIVRPKIRRVKNEDFTFWNVYCRKRLLKGYHNVNFELVKYGHRIVKENLDILYIFEKSVKFEVFMYSVLDNFQFMAMQFLKKPKLKEPFNFMGLQKKAEEQRSECLRELKHHYARVKRENNLTSVDEKILESVAL